MPGETALPDWLVHARTFIASNFREPIGLAEASRAARVQPPVLARAHRRFFNCTVGEAIRGLRLGYAAALLRETALALTEVAGRSGFYDSPHLIRSFLGHYGMSPTQFRVRHGLGSDAEPVS